MKKDLVVNEKCLLSNLIEFNKKVGIHSKTNYTKGKNVKTLWCLIVDSFLTRVDGILRRLSKFGFIHFSIFFSKETRQFSLRMLFEVKIYYLSWEQYDEFLLSV